MTPEQTRQELLPVLNERGAGLTLDEDGAAVLHLAPTASFPER